MAEKKDKKFDQGMAELEAIVARLEAGELPLEEALAAFEAGVTLVRTLNQRLNDACVVCHQQYRINYRKRK